MREVFGGNKWKEIDREIFLGTMHKEELNFETQNEHSQSRTNFMSSVSTNYTPWGPVHMENLIQLQVWLLLVDGRSIVVMISRGVHKLVSLDT